MATDTRAMDGVVLGFDPGGRNDDAPSGNFGWSICQIVGSRLRRLETGLARDAVDALGQVHQELVRQGHPRVLAAGVDAPMFWGQRGNRAVDDVVKQALQDIQVPVLMVIAVNGLRGAVTVQGPLLGWHLRARWPGLPITEAHPTAMWKLLRQRGPADTVNMVRRLTAGIEAANERDATRAAVGAWAMKRRLPGWRDLLDVEPTPVHPFGAVVNYWMPIPVGSE